MCTFPSPPQGLRAAICLSSVVPAPTFSSANPALLLQSTPYFVPHLSLQPIHLLSRVFGSTTLVAYSSCRLKTKRQRLSTFTQNGFGIMHFPDTGKAVFIGAAFHHKLMHNNGGHQNTSYPPPLLIADVTFCKL